MSNWNVFIQGLGSSAEVIGRMTLLVLTGFFMVRKNLLKRDTLSDLTRFLIDVVIPCAFVLAMVRSFSLELLDEGILLALFSAGWIGVSWMAATLFYKLLPGQDPESDRAVTAMIMISNSLYLPLPVILAVTPPELHDRAIALISIVALPSILFMWTAGVKLLGGSHSIPPGERLRRILNPPIVSFFAGILLSFVPGLEGSARGEPGGLPVISTLLAAMDFLGGMLSPLAMIILGGMIASAGKPTGTPLRYAIPLILARLVIVPGVVYLIISRGIVSVPPLGATVLVLVSAAPPATNHSLIARRYHGNWQLVSSLQLVVHLIALVTLPLWLSAAQGLL